MATTNVGELSGVALDLEGQEPCRGCRNAGPMSSMPSRERYVYAAVRMPRSLNRVRMLLRRVS